MAKYSAFKYGDGTKYGLGEQDADLLWGFTVAWDGYYGWGNEANRMISLSVKRGRRTLAGKNGIVPFDVGEAVGIFDNEDGRYDPFNASSPIYGYITPGKFVRIVVRDEPNTTTYGIMRGTVADIQPFRAGGKERVRIVVRDGLQWIKDNTINIGLRQSVAKNTIPNRITDFVDWPDTEWNMDLDSDTTTHEYYWAWNQNALNALNEFNSAEWSVTFHDRDGKFVWHQRDFGHERTLALTEEDLLDEVGRPQPWEVVRNKIRAEVKTKVLDNINSVIWSLQDTPEILDGAEFYIEPLFRYAEWFPCGASITFNHTVNSASDGSGSDLTASCFLTYNEEIGEGAQITITNNSGSDGYITALTATGDAIYPPNENVVVAEDATSQADYGLRTMYLGSRWIEDTDYAIALIDWLLTNLKDPSQYPIIQMEDKPDKQFTLDLYDRVELSVPTLTISDNFRVGHIEHQTIGESCQGVRTTMRLEPYMQFS